MNLEIESIINKEVYPAISVILPIHPRIPDIKLDSEHMVIVLKSIEKKLEDKYGNEISIEMMKRVKDTFSKIPANHLQDSLIVYISQDIVKVINLPFRLKEKIIIDSSFEVRDLLYAEQRNISYLLVIISKKKVKTFIGNLFKLTTLEFPDTPDHIALINRY